jgi:hypothetical protein
VVEKVSWENYPDDLYRMGLVLQSQPQTAQTGAGLIELSGRVRSRWSTTRRMEVRELSLPLPRSKKIMPTGCQIGQAYLTFIFDVSTESVFPNLAEYQIKLAGELRTETAVIALEDHWRLDTDPYAHNQSDDPSKRNQGEAREPHSLYHFQRGGRAQEEFAGMSNFFPAKDTLLEQRDWRGLFQCPGPRIPTLPFDPILLIDFCIGQHDGAIWWNLRNEPEYLEVVRSAQERLWLPFLNCLTSQQNRRKWFGQMALA